MSKCPIMSRMKANYESRQQHYLTRRMPVILRLDGKAFHTYTAALKDRFHPQLIGVMNLAAIKLMEEIQGAKVAYVQSDEINILLIDYDSLTTEAWFDYNKSKIESVSASIAGATFTLNSWMIWSQWLAHQPGDMSLQSGRKPYYEFLYDDLKPAYFDCRGFNIPESEVANYFIARQKDCQKNSVSSLALYHYSHKELHGKNCSQMQEMCWQKGHNWNDLATHLKRGRCIVKESYELEPNEQHPKSKSAVRTRWVVDNEIPIFQQDRAYIEKYIPSGEDDGNNLQEVSEQD